MLTITTSWLLGDAVLATQGRAQVSRILGNGDGSGNNQRKMPDEKVIMPL